MLFENSGGCIDVLDVVEGNREVAVESFVLFCCGMEGMRIENSGGCTDVEIVEEI